MNRRLLRPQAWELAGAVGSIRAYIDGDRMIVLTMHRQHSMYR